MHKLRSLAALGTAVVTGLALAAAPVQAHGSHHPHAPDGVLAEGLADPFGLTVSGRSLVVTEAGAGRVLTIDKWSGRLRTAVDGLGPYAASSAVKIGRRFVIVTGEADPSAPAGPVPGSSVLVARAGGTPRQFADLLAFELANNPDGQTQFGPDGAPLDALSNPFSVARDRTGKGLVLVADGGANSVLRVSRTGRVSAFFVPPTVNTGACEGLPNNDESTVGCDAVPTGVAFGPRNRVYISALTAEVPGEGRIYVVNGRSGRLIRVMSGFTAPTGVAVAPNGTVYVSELLENAPEGDPGPDFDPSTVGQLVKVSRSGHRTTAQVTLPVGVAMSGWRLYSTAWSVAGLFLGAEGLGQVVRVAPDAFDGEYGAPGGSARPGALAKRLPMLD